MTPEQRYLFDINGYLHLPNVLSGSELNVTPRCGLRKQNQNQAKQAPATSRKCLFFGEPTGNRTQDLRIKSPVLYQLSYRLFGAVSNSK